MREAMINAKVKVPPDWVPPPGKLAPKSAATAKRAHIRCPHCKWQPVRSSRWMCSAVGHPEYLTSGCGHIWNTFDTGGLCPGCQHQWQHTACLSCARWAPHLDWYVAGGDDAPG